HDDVPGQDCRRAHHCRENNSVPLTELEEWIMKDAKVNDVKTEAGADEIEMTDEEMSQIKGGALLLPAVQKVREAAARNTTTTAKLGDGSVRPFGGTMGDEGAM